MLIKRKIVPSLAIKRQTNVRERYGSKNYKITGSKPVIALGCTAMAIFSTYESFSEGENKNAFSD